MNSELGCMGSMKMKSRGTFENWLESGKTAGLCPSAPRIAATRGSEPNQNGASSCLARATASSRVSSFSFGFQTIHLGLYRLRGSRQFDLDARPRSVPGRLTQGTDLPAVDFGHFADDHRAQAHGQAPVLRVAEDSGRPPLAVLRKVFLAHARPVVLDHD